MSQDKVELEGALIQRRTEALGTGLRQFYDFPFHPVRGDDVWLIDGNGARFLDAYNNVAHVGHCHPDVVSALCRQARTLNTNTRYLDETIVHYAERLASTMPPGLTRCMFTCTGTESNDLAWRIAKADTGNSGVIASEFAYHGNSSTIAALDGAIAANHHIDWIGRISIAPNTTLKDIGNADELAAMYVHRVEQAIARLAEKGHKPAAFIFDTAFATDGLYMPASGILDAAVRCARDAGALIIADEVQAGFGRLGGHMWGFQALGINPDIVTLGKPAGNGHPIGAVITSPAKADSLFKQDRYFNTFGGNPVSAACGVAVLDIIERENLVRNAMQVGAYMRAALAGLASRYDAISEVRGNGLFIGVQLGSSKGVPATATKARKIINELARRGVLIGITGPDKSLLKIRPPMTFSKHHADQLVETLDAVLLETATQ